MSVEWRERITSLNLLATFLFMQPRIQFQPIGTGLQRETVGGAHTFESFIMWSSDKIHI